MSSVIGTSLSRYRIVERLGAGATADVYRAEDTRLRRQVALKVLRGGSPQALVAEARAASALAHPNIAVIYEVDRADVEGVGVEFIAMELVVGRTLADLIAAGTLSLDQSLDIVRQTAGGLAAAHARGFVHRDIKPANLMVTDAGLVKVLDFGLARASRALLRAADDPTTSGDLLTVAAAPAGTLPYMAPEQIRGDALDGRADMFSLGVVLYELLTGRRPFDDPNPVVLLESLLRDPPPPLAPRFDDPRALRLEPALRRMLEKDRGQRYETLGDVVAVVTAAARGEEVRSAEPDRERLAVGSFVNITGNPDDEWLGTGLAETLTAGFSQLDGHIAVPRARVHELMRVLAQEGADSDEALAQRAAAGLGARWFVSGGFQCAGGQVRVTATVLDAANRTVAGIVKVDGRLDDIFALQDQLVRDVVGVLRAVTRPSATTTETGVVEAYEAFSKGVINLRVESYESLDRAVWLFERAVTLDPQYARAHIELGAAYSTKADYLAMPDLRRCALASLRRGLDLQPGSARAWRELGAVLIARGDEAEGLAAIRRALAIDPQDAGALGAMGRALFVGLARFRDAVPYFEQALERNPNAGWYALQLTHCFALLRDFERGETAAQRAAALQEAELSGQDGVLIVGAFMRRGHLAALQGRDEEAVGHFLKEIEFLSRVDHALRTRILVELNTRLGASYLRLGAGRKAQAALDVALEGFDRRIRLGADDPFTRYYAASVYALRGDVETTLAMLERASLDRRAFTLERARIEPEFDGVRADPRFTRLIGKRG
jgi:eukaryotic-like serine/threonine-protein kinase